MNPQLLRAEASSVTSSLRFLGEGTNLVQTDGQRT